MEEPDREGTPVVFTAKEGTCSKNSGSKKEAKISIGGRLRGRKSTPRMVMKGSGKKRFSLSPAPDHKPMHKRATISALAGEVATEIALKRNLLNVLNEAADNKEEGGDTTTEAEEGKAGGTRLPNKEVNGNNLTSQEVEEKADGNIVTLAEEKRRSRKGKVDSSEKGPAPQGNPNMAVDGNVRPLPLDRLGAQNTQALVLAGHGFENQKGKYSTVGEKRNVVPKSNQVVGQSTHNNSIVSCTDNDILLDPVSSQPLSKTTPLALNSQPPEREGADTDTYMGGELEYTTEFEKQFPPLAQGATTLLAARYEGMSRGNKEWSG